MAKSSKKDIERDEKKVLYQLMEDSSQSINDVSDKLGFSRQKVWRIIKKLHDDKTIWGYTAIVDNEKLGMKNFILIGKRNAKPISQDLVEAATSKKIEKLARSVNCYVENTYYLNGQYDFISTFKAPNVMAAKRYQEEFTRLYEGFLTKTLLLEVIFPLRINGLMNPGIKKLSELL